jgi:nucleoside-diphosphate-sugar epimerase
MNDLLKLIAEIAGIKPNISKRDKQFGDVRHTWADTTLAKTELRWTPTFSLREGLKQEFEWIRSALDSKLPPFISP